MKNIEHLEQATLFQWASLNEERIPALKNLFAIPNGGHRHKAVAAKMRAEGVKAGVPDAFLAFPWDGYSGLFIEMKAGRNKTTPAQDEWIGRLCQAGYAVAVCYGWEAAKKEILDYLGVEDGKDNDR